MIWREPKDCSKDCYFCLGNTQGFSTKSKSNIEYPNLRLAMKSVVHCNETLVPIFREASEPGDKVIDEC